MRRVVTIMIVLMSLTACIRDSIPACPPMEVTLSVLDKNYSNIADFKDIGLEPKQENLPFNEYVGTVYYRLSNPEDGSDVEIKGPFPVETQDGTFTLPVSPSIPHGTYEITVWGGLKDASGLSNDAGIIKLHNDGHSGEDIYLAHGTFTYDAWNNEKQLEMERTKGQLVLMMEGLTSEKLEIEANIKGVYETVDHSLNYQGSCNCSDKVYTDDTGKTSLNIAPTDKKRKGRLGILYRNAEGKEFTPDDISVEIKRNTITVVKYIYDPDSDKFSIYLFIDGQWEKYHDMEIG